MSERIEIRHDGELLHGKFPIGYVVFSSPFPQEFVGDWFSEDPDEEDWLSEGPESSDDTERLEALQGAVEKFLDSRKIDPTSLRILREALDAST